MWVFLFFLIILLMGFFLIGIGLLVGIYKKDVPKIKSNLKWFVILFIFSGVLFKKLPGSNLFWWPFESVESKFYTDDLIGKSFILPEPIYELDSERAFNGDGETMLVYSLNSSVIDYLENVDSLFYRNYPKIELTKKWKTNTWKNTPIEDVDLDAFSFALYSDENSGYDLRKMINEEDNFYAFHYYSNSDNGLEHFFDINFYIINPKKKILIILNVNT